MNLAPEEQRREPNPQINPKLREHYGTKGSITALTAATMRRQLEMLIVICLRPRGVSL